MCRCSDAQITDDEMVREFGRLPARMKQQIRHVIGFDASDVNGNIPSGCGGAFNGGDNMAFFGDCDGPSVWMVSSPRLLNPSASTIPFSWILYSRLCTNIISFLISTRLPTLSTSTSAKDNTSAPKSLQTAASQMATPDPATLRTLLN